MQIDLTGKTDTQIAYHLQGMKGDCIMWCLRVSNEHR